MRSHYQRISGVMLHPNQIHPVVSWNLLHSQIINNYLFWQRSSFLETPEAEWLVGRVNS